jgi:hypothetical protein
VLRRLLAAGRVTWPGDVDEALDAGLEGLVLAARRAGHRQRRGQVRVLAAACRPDEGLDLRIGLLLRDSAARSAREAPDGAPVLLRR